MNRKLKKRQKLAEVEEPGWGKESICEDGEEKEKRFEKDVIKSGKQEKAKNKQKINSIKG